MLIRWLVLMVFGVTMVSCAHISPADNPPAALAERVAHLTTNLAVLRAEHEQLRPTIMHVSEGIDIILRQIEDVLGDYAGIVHTTITKANVAQIPHDVPSETPSEIQPDVLTIAAPVSSEATPAPAVLLPVVMADPPAVIATPVSATEGKFYLHIASYLSAETAKHQWQDYQQHHPQLLGDLTLHLSQIKVRNQELTRMMGGLLTDRNEAYERCRKLVGLGIYCKVTAVAN